jgi:hypothetical protein
MPFTPFPLLRIQIENTIMNFDQFIINSMGGKIVFHLSDAVGWIRAIKFVHLNPRKMGVTIGMQVQRIGRVNTFELGVWARGGRTLGAEWLESGFELCYWASDIVLHVVQFDMNGNDVII